MVGILVTGATGTIGGCISAALASRGVPHRVLVRDPARFPADRPGIEVATGDFADARSLGAALSGIRRLFLASFDRGDLPGLQRSVIEAAARAGVTHVVRMSTIGVAERPGVPIFATHLACERQLEASGLGWTHLRPAWVMQNFLGFVRADWIRLPAGEGRAAFVDARDIGEVGALALAGPGHEGRAYDLTGPEALSHAQVAAALSAATGRAIRYDDIPPATWAAEKAAAGWPRASIDSLLALFADLRAGRSVDAVPTDTVRTLTGRAPIPFAAFARDHAGSFGAV